MKKQEQGYIRVRLQRAEGRGADAQQEYFSVNGKGYCIRRGKDVSVPEAVAEVIRNGEKAEDAAFDYTASVAFRSPV